MHQLFRISLSEKQDPRSAGLATPIEGVCQSAGVPQSRFERELAESIEIVFCRFIIQVALQRVIKLDGFIRQIVW